MSTTSTSAGANPLAHNVFIVKEHVGMFKAASNYDVYDAEGGEMVFACREEKLGMFTKILRFTDYKRMTPFNLEVRTTDGELVVRVRRGVALLRSRVDVFDGNETRLGGFKQKLWSIGGKFEVLDQADKPICMLSGNWSGWDFRFVVGDQELATVTKKWAGLGKELLTSADNYVLTISDTVPSDAPVRKMILAAVMCIDLVLKE